MTVDLDDLNRASGGNAGLSYSGSDFAPGEYLPSDSASDTIAPARQQPQRTHPTGYSEVDTIAIHGQPEATGQDAVVDATQLRQDVQKVVSPYYQDSIDFHPDAKKKERVDLQMAIASPASASATSSDETYTDKVYDFGNWLWGLVFPEDEVDGTDPRPAGARELEELMMQDVFGNGVNRDIRIEDFHRFVDEMRQLVHRIQDYNTEFADEVNFEALLAMIFKAQIEERQQEASVHHEKILQDLVEQRQVSKERLEKMDELVGKNKSSEMWTLFDKVATGLGLIAAGATVSTGVGAVVFLVGVGLTADSIFDDKAKRAVAGLFSGNNEEKQDQYTEYLKLGAGVMSIAVFMGMSGQKSLSAAASVARGASTIGKGYSKYSTDGGHADLKEIGASGDKKAEALKKDTGKISSMVKNVHQYYMNLSDIVRNQQDTFVSVAR